MNNSTNLVVFNQKKRKIARGLHLLLLFATCLIGQVSFAQFPSPYCDVDAFDVEEITKIQFAGLTIVNTNEEDFLVNRIADVANVTRGQSYTLIVEGNTYYDMNELAAFIDWNQNGVLDDVGEVYNLGELIESNGHDDINVSLSIPIPTTAVLGQTRIRITKTWTYAEYGGYLIEDPCFISFFDPDIEEIDSSYGQALDFTLNITDGTTPPEGNEGCEIEISLTFPEYGDVTTWKLLDGAGTVVLRGGPYEESEFTIAESYYGTNPPYSLQIDIDDSIWWYCDNEVQYTITVGDVEDQSGTVSACEELVSETIAIGSCPPGCMKPGVLKKNNITATGFTFSWVSGGNEFEIEYGPLGFVQGSTDGTIISSITTTSYTFSDLNNDEAYQFYVRRICSDEEGDHSAWAGPLTFDEIITTPSPWHEDFEASTNYPFAWHPVGNSLWGFESYDTDHGTSMVTMLYNYIIFPPREKAEFTTINVGPIRTGDVFSFNYLLLDGAEYPAYEGLGNVVVKLSTDFGASYSTIETIDGIEEEGWQNFSFDLEDYVGLYVKIKIEANVTDIFEDFLVILDDFDISNTANCKEVTSAEVEMDATGMTLNIESEATAFIIEYGPAGFEQGEGTVVNNVTAPYTFTDLELDTDYDAYVQALPCGDWYGPVAFTTLPLTEQVITAEDVAKVYGEAPFAHGTSSSGLPLSYVIEDPTIATFQNGKFTIRKVGVTEVTASQAGNSSFLPAEDVTFTLTITPAMLTVTANSEQSKQYSQVNPVLTYEVTGFKYNDTATVLTGALSREPGEEIGTYAITQGTLAAEPNYAITLVSADFSIGAKEITIKANAQQKEYGEIDPALTYEVIGLEEGILPTSVVGGALTRIAGENVGNYAITIGSLEVVDAHYTMTFQESQLRIYPAVLSLYPANGAQKVYGQTDPVFEFTVTGFKYNDTREAVLSGRLGRMTGENVGQYMYTQGSLETTHGNYSFTVANQEKFRITVAPLHVVVNPNQSKSYGQADPVLTYTLNGLMLGDHQANATRGNLVREVGEELGVYAIHQGSLEARSNYVIASFVGADFEIKQSQITGVALPSQTFVYDGQVKSLAVIGVDHPNATISYTNNNQVNVGVYQVTAIVDYGNDYQPLTLNGSLTITKADQMIAFRTASVVVMEDTPTLQLTGSTNANLPVYYRINNAEEQTIATVDERGLVRFLKPGFVTITAYQDGNENYNAAMPVSNTIEVTSRAVGIENLLVDGISYGKPEKDVFVVIGCGQEQNQVIIEVQVADGVEVLPSKYIVVPVKEYGAYEQRITVISPRGMEEETYVVHIEKRIDTTHLIYQKYNNVLLVNNNKETNGGYVFKAYEWFKNGVSIGNKQSYAEGSTSADVLEVGAAYHVVLTLHNGKKMVSCPIYIENKAEANWGVYPNPVQRTQQLNVRLDDDQQQAMSYVIYDAKGQMILKGDFIEGSTDKEIQLPPTVAVGSYFLVLKGSGTQKSVQFVVRE